MRRFGLTPNAPRVSKKLKNIGVVSFFTVISRGLAVWRDQVQAKVFGETVFIDAFVTAFTLPNLFRRLLGEGALTAAFLPALQQELHERGEPAAFALLNRVASWLAVATTALVGLAMLLFGNARLILGWVGDWHFGASVRDSLFGNGGELDSWFLVADLTVIVFPYLALVCVAAAFNAALNVLGRFTESSLSPIWLNVAMIVSLAGAGLHFAHSPLGEAHWLCVGVLVGGFFQMAVPAVALVRAGWRPRFVLELTPAVRQIAALMTPGLFGTAIYQINITVSRLLAFSLPGAAAILFFANRWMELPIGVFAIAISTVVYPAIARHAVERNFSAMAGDFHKGLRLILVLNVPAAAGLALLSTPIVRIIYEHGKFTADNTHAMAGLLALFVIGLPFFSIVNLTVRAFYALKDTATPVRVAAIDFVVNLVLSVLLKRWLGAPGLVIASTAAIVVQTLLLQRALARKLPSLAFAPLWRSVAKVIIATGVMSAAVGAGNFALQAAAIGGRADWIAVLGLIPLGALTYGAVLWALNIEGREEFAALLAKFRGKFA